MENSKNFALTVYILEHYYHYLKSVNNDEYNELGAYDKRNNYIYNYIGRVYKSYMSLKSVEKTIFNKVYIDKAATRKELSRSEQLYLDIATLKFLEVFYA